MAVVLIQGVATTVSMGPFVSSTDADTPLLALTITPADIQLSHNDGGFASTAAATGGSAQGLGYYQIPLSPVDTGTLGRGRLSVQMPGALPVWLDLLIVTAPVYARFFGLPSALVVLRGSTPTLMVGPFVAISDGSTVLSALTIAQADIALSKAQGAPVTTQQSGGAVAAGFGHYQVTLAPGDSDTLGPLRLEIDPPSALPVWMTVIVVPLAVWQMLFPPAPPVIVIPPVPPGPLPLPGDLHAGDLLPRLSAILDDGQMIRWEEPVLLRYLSRAQQWVALRYRLCLETYGLVTHPRVPWYDLARLLPSIVVATDVVGPDGVSLNPVPMSRLRYTSPQWLVPPITPVTPTRYYRVGWTILGFTPVPLLAEVLTVTGIVMPRPLTQATDVLQIASAYHDAVLRVAEGLALMSHDGAYALGMQRIMDGLAVAPPVAQGAAA